MIEASHPPNRPRIWKLEPASRIALATAAYIVASWMAGALTLPPSASASFRPPNALLVAVALLDVPGRWWVYTLAAIPGNPSLYHPATPLLASFGYAIANAIEVALGIGIARKLIGRAPRLTRLSDCSVFVLGVALGSSALAAGVGVGAAVLERPARSLALVWRNWFLADALTYVTLAPAILLAAQGRWRITKERRWEAMALVVGLVTVAALTLDGQFGQVSRLPALVYAPLPFLLWAALRFGPLENALAVMTMSGVVLAMALTGRGAFAGLSPVDSALSMQLLVFILAVPLMFLAATVDEHRESEERFKKIFHSSPDSITISALADGRLIDVNERFEQISGIPRSAAIGRTTADLGLWTDFKAREEFVRRVMAEGRVRDFLVPTTYPDRVLYGRLSAEPIELDGKEALITVQRDVTDAILAGEEKARLESQMQQTRRMEAIGQLAGGIAHDFNNLLQAITGYTELAGSGLEPGDRARTMLERVTAAANRASSLTRQLLTFSRRDAIKAEPIDLSLVVHDTVRILHRVIGEHIRLVVNGAPDLPAIDADRSQIEQIVMNLCINARDAMPSGGLVTIDTGAEVLSENSCRTRAWARPGHWVFLRVADTGEGVPPEIQSRIFEPFFTTKEAGRGTGLGLATVYAIVEGHRGLIALQSAVGAGSAFTIYFPASGPGIAAARAEAKPASPAKGGRGECVLVAEDEPFVRELAVEMLEGDGYEVLVAADGAEAEALVRDGSRAIHAAVLDVVMPLRSGREIFDTMQQVRPGVPIVFCSGYAFGELSDTASLARITVLEKPYTRTALVSAVRMALDSAPPNV